MSLSARRAWIEISWQVCLTCRVVVALRKESVDRNVCAQEAVHLKPVALRKESVDRNSKMLRASLTIRESLSARRAWIEIVRQHGGGPFAFVALRKESVDRNTTSQTVVSSSLVALRKESVDRNIFHRLRPPLP